MRQHLRCFQPNLAHSCAKLAGAVEDITFLLLSTAKPKCVWSRTEERCRREFRIPIHTHIYILCDAATALKWNANTSKSMWLKNALISKHCSFREQRPSARFSSQTRRFLILTLALTASLRVRPQLSLSIFRASQIAASALWIMTDEMTDNDINVAGLTHLVSFILTRYCERSHTH